MLQAQLLMPFMKQETVGAGDGFPFPLFLQPGNLPQPALLSHLAIPGSSVLERLVVPNEVWVPLLECGMMPVPLAD